MRGKQQFIFRLIVSLAIVITSFFAAMTLMYLFSPVKVNAITIPKTVPTTVSDITTPAIVFNVPMTLKIDSINVDARINPVGVTPSGNMDIDENPKELAWYKFGAKPGEKGNAVIAGHYGWKNGVPSVFNDLNQLEVGNKISSFDDKGQEIIFAVTRTELYKPDQDAIDVFKSKDGKSHLNLITCQGSWNNSARTYNERLVVFTDRVEQ
jgi:sortase A